MTPPGKLTRWACTVAVFVAFLGTAACFPSDPEPPPFGVRREAGVLSVLVPHCGGEKVAAARVTPVDPDKELPAAWNASGFTGDQNDGVSFARTEWSSVRGDYTSLTEFFVVVEMDRGRTYGGLLERSDLASLDDLPAATFMVNGRPSTIESYTRRVARFCPKPQKSSIN